MPTRDGNLSTFSLRRYHFDWGDEHESDDAHRVEVVIDGTTLGQLLAAVGAGGEPLWYRDVAPPSRQWLGDPSFDLCAGNLTAVNLGCGEWRCCGTGASVTLGDAVVTWRIQNLGTYRFDRAEYEAAIAGLPELQEVSIPARDLDSDA